MFIFHEDFLGTQYFFSTPIFKLSIMYLRCHLFGKLQHTSTLVEASVRARFEGHDELEETSRRMRALVLRRGEEKLTSKHVLVSGLSTGG